MWIPSSEGEILRRIATGDLQETPDLDFKRELPPTASGNQSVAKDAAAMSTDGGVIIYGVGQRDRQRGAPLEAFPIAAVAKAEERLSQIISSNLPGLFFTVDPVRCDKDKTSGYLILHVPPSPLAPHMAPDGRFWTRRGTENYPLTQGEVDRLYERRVRLATNTNARIDQAIGLMPKRRREEFRHLAVYAAPISGSPTVLSERGISGKELQDTLTLTPLLATKLAAPFGEYRHFRAEPRGFIASRSQQEFDVPYDSIVRVGYDGTVHFFHERVGFPEPRNGSAKWFCGGAVLQQVSNVLRFSRELLVALRVTGFVDLAVVASNLLGSVWSEDAAVVSYVEYPEKQFANATRVSLAALEESMIEQTVRRLVSPMVDTFLQGRGDPFTRNTSLPLDPKVRQIQIGSLR